MPPPNVYRRRRIVALLLLAGAVALLALALVTLGGDDSSRTASAPSPPPECGGASARDLRLSLGSRIVVRMEDRATGGLLSAARAGRIGGVVLFPARPGEEQRLARQIGRLQRAAAAGAHPPLIVSVDQEGGEVKRFPELPPEQPPPALAGDPQAAEAEGAATGAALARIGINADLAPVLDVPAGESSFIAARTFGRDADQVAEAGVAFASGLADAGVIATAKHFPGLGRAPANTDLAASEVGAGRAALTADLRPFEGAIDAGVAMVMLSNAAYPALDPDLPAFASPAIVSGLLRNQLGFDGTTITDDLEAAAVRAELDRSQAALAAVAAGTDLLLFAQTDDPEVLGSLVAAARQGELDAASLSASCARVAELRERFAG